MTVSPLRVELPAGLAWEYPEMPKLRTPIQRDGSVLFAVCEDDSFVAFNEVLSYGLIADAGSDAGLWAAEDAMVAAHRLLASHYAMVSISVGTYGLRGNDLVSGAMLGHIFLEDDLLDFFASVTPLASATASNVITDGNGSWCGTLPSGEFVACESDYEIAFSDGNRPAVREVLAQTDRSRLLRFVQHRMSQLTAASGGPDRVPEGYKAAYSPAKMALGIPTDLPPVEAEARYDGKVRHFRGLLYGFARDGGFAVVDRKSRVGFLNGPNATASLDAARVGGRMSSVAVTVMMTLRMMNNAAAGEEGLPAAREGAYLEALEALGLSDRAAA